MATINVTTPFPNVTLPAGKTFTFTFAAEPGAFYQYNVSNVRTANPSDQVVLTLVNGGGINTGVPSGSWCSVTNTSAVEGTFDILLLSVMD